MNSETNHVVSSKFLDELRKAQVADGYRPIPRQLGREAESLLAGREETYLPETGTALDRLAAKRRTRNRNKRMRRQLVPGY